jgi:hypothetical protein
MTGAPTLSAVHIASFYTTKKMLNFDIQEQSTKFSQNQISNKLYCADMRKKHCQCENVRKKERKEKEKNRPELLCLLQDLEMELLETRDQDPFVPSQVCILEACELIQFERICYLIKLNLHDSVSLLLKFFINFI